MNGPATGQAEGRRAAVVIAALGVGYVGIYLCRKNLAVALPLLGVEYGATKAELGRIASFSTLAYAAGKFLSGPPIDRVGGRRGFLVAMGAVALFGALGGLAPGLGALTLAYSLNRFAGAGAWGAMIKVVPSWYPPRKLGRAVAVLSLSYVLGGAAATLLGRELLRHGWGWRGVMGLPSLALVVVGLAAARVVRTGPLEVAAPPRSSPRPQWAEVRALVTTRRFLVLLGLAFIVTLLREAFNTWAVDFLATIDPAAGAAGAVERAALGATAFDVAGGLGILLMGSVYDRVPPRRRGAILAADLLALGLLLLTLQPLAGTHPALVPWLLALIGLLVYGPYSLLAGALAVESAGTSRAATAAGMVDGVGYLAGILAGGALGWLLDRGGYTLGFQALAGLTLPAAAVALLYRAVPGDA